MSENLIVWCSIIIGFVVLFIAGLIRDMYVKNLEAKVNIYRFGRATEVDKEYKRREDLSP